MFLLELVAGKHRKLRSGAMDLAAAETNNKYQKGFTMSGRAVSSIWPVWLLP
jgi:hypothetical protein